MSKVRTTQQLVGAFVSATIDVRVKFGYPSNCSEYSIIKSNISDVALDQVGKDDPVKFSDYMLNSG